MRGFEKCKERLPSKEKFYSSVTAKKISNKDYEHAVKVQNKFQIKAMESYHDFY